VSGLGWRTVFLVNLPIVAVAVPATVRLVTENVTEGSRRLDPPGMVLATLTLAATVSAVIIAGRTGIATPIWIIAAAVAVLALAGFLVWERHAHSPMLPLPLLRNRAFAGANLVAAAMNLVGIGTVFVASLYLQTVQHRGAFAAGLMLLPLFVPLAALAPVTGRLTGRFGPRPSITAGLILGAAGSFALLGITPSTSYPRLLPVLLGLGIGMGLLTAAVVAAAVRAAPGDQSGLASGVNNTARQAAGALAIAVYGAITGSPADAAHFVDGVHIIALIGGTAWLAALALTWSTIPGKSD